ncbi:MAG: S-layer homology domain-containing protein, partial [Clostridia bacterium]|nr:S-layer homology domain-containing protein [Clostridia bacterium]
RRAGEHWAGPFWEYCKAEGIIDSRFDGRLDEPVTREEMAYYFAHTLNERYYGGSHPVAISDVESSPYRDDILKLAKADIVGGGPTGTFRPGDFVTRAEATVFVRNILNRLK